MAGRQDWQHPPAPHRRVTSETFVTPSRARARMVPSVVPVHSQMIMCVPAVVELGGTALPRPAAPIVRNLTFIIKSRRIIFRVPRRSTETPG